MSLLNFIKQEGISKNLINNVMFKYLTKLLDIDLLEVISIHGDFIKVKVENLDGEIKELNIDVELLKLVEVI